MGCNYSQPWEELAEDPFRGLRAGPADFSPFTSAAVSRKPPDHTKTSNTPNYRTRQRCAWANSLEQSRFLPAPLFEWDNAILGIGMFGSGYAGVSMVPGVTSLRLGSMWRVV